MIGKVAQKGGGSIETIKNAGEACRNMKP